MLTRLRPVVSDTLSRIAAPLARLPADLYTVLGLTATLPYLYATYTGNHVAATLFLLLSAGLDALDGAVARLRGEAGPRGAYLDSLLDRVADAAYAAGLILLGFPPLLAYLFAAASLLISYARAKYESLTGRSMEGTGIMERGDRVLALAAVIAIHGYEPATGEELLAAITLAAWATFVQRLVKGYRDLPREHEQLARGQPPRT